MVPVSRSEWATPTSVEVVQRRAAGRRRYNAVRRLRAQLRGVTAFRLMCQYDWARGAQSRVAAELGVHRSTISRDLAAVPRPPDEARCPACGAVRLPPDLVEAIEQQADIQEVGIKEEIKVASSDGRADTGRDGDRHGS